MEHTPCYLHKNRWIVQEATTTTVPTHRISPWAPGCTLGCPMASQPWAPRATPTNVWNAIPSARSHLQTKTQKVWGMKMKVWAAITGNPPPHWTVVGRPDGRKGAIWLIQVMFVDWKMFIGASHYYNFIPIHCMIVNGSILWYY